MNKTTITMYAGLERVHRLPEARRKAFHKAMNLGYSLEWYFDGSPADGELFKFSDGEVLILHAGESRVVLGSFEAPVMVGSGGHPTTAVLDLLSKLEHAVEAVQALR